jgi:hypothetical protein
LLIGCAGLCAVVASAKNQGAASWFFAGLLFGILALIAIAGMPTLPEKEPIKTARMF